MDRVRYGQLSLYELCSLSDHGAGTTDIGDELDVPGLEEEKS
jgi:hypothetical protein